jgi:hypothetical protein
MNSEAGQTTPPDGRCAVTIARRRYLPNQEFAPAFHCPGARLQ